MKRIVAEGIEAGALGATAVATWFLLYDVVQGRPYFTPALLGAVLFHGLRDVAAVSISWPLVLGYSLLHWAAFALFGIAAAALLAEADRQPALLFVFVMLVCCFEVFALALVAVLAEWRRRNGRSRRAFAGVSLDRKGGRRLGRSAMVKLVAFSIGNIFLGLVAAVGLAAYTAAHPFGVGLVGMSTAASSSRHVEPALVDCGSAPGPDGRAPRRRPLG